MVAVVPQKPIAPFVRWVVLGLAQAEEILTNLEAGETVEIDYERLATALAGK